MDLRIVIAVETPEDLYTHERPFTDPQDALAWLGELLAHLYLREQNGRDRSHDPRGWGPDQPPVGGTP